jgi:hypothetical protein
METNISEVKTNAFNKILNLILKGEKQKVCRLEATCGFVSGQVSQGIFTESYANNYRKAICKTYPNACELNLENKGN